MSSMSREIVALTRTLGSRAEASTLLAHVLGVHPRELLFAKPPTDAQRADLDALAARRLAGEPLQHVTGRAAFRTVEVAVGPGVFIPRPETEVMVGWALDRLAEASDHPTVVELCAGSGAISLALVTEAPSTNVHAVELSDEAWPYLTRNLAGTTVDVRLGDMAEAFPELDGQVDLVIANPPYIPLDSYAEVPAEVREYDPTMALFSGADGLDAMRVVARVAHRLLKPGGWVCAEHADVQGASAPRVFLDHGGFDRVADQPDLNARPRFVVGRRAGKMAP